MGKSAKQPIWLSEPEAHDYPAARSYLSLIFDPQLVATQVAELQEAAVTAFKAKDIFRASQLPLLGISNAHVEKNHAKIEAGTPLSPLLLVRYPAHSKVIVADGYHRMCAVYTYDEDALIPCKIV